MNPIPTPPPLPAAPPREVRRLAALAHLGFWFGSVLFLAGGVAAFVVDAVQHPERTRPATGEWEVLVVQTLMVGGALAAPCAVLWAARRSFWGEFLRSHAALALVVQSAAFLSIVMLRLVCDLFFTLSEPVISFLDAVCRVLVAGWCVLSGAGVLQAVRGRCVWHPAAPRFLAAHVRAAPSTSVQP